MEEYETTNMMIYLYTIYDKSKEIYMNYGLKIIARLSKSAGAQSSYFAACPAENKSFGGWTRIFWSRFPWQKTFNKDKYNIKSSWRVGGVA